ncbi:MAG TPA: Rieske 2Fe-2S domain-containing protein [Chloroflexota bacterium]|nr:Rieske 2Fe-2S domain-containing protein [Chloroflexota bacterium]
MFLNEEENRKLAQVGPGTPGGELLRRYWQPIAGLHQVTEGSPTAFVRILGEDLVLFRDKSGNVGLLADHCAHRGASLLYGRVEERGIACAYHGWLYDTKGSCLETPAEPGDSKFHLTVKQRAYPVEKYLGLYWTYMGPPPVPPIRRFDMEGYPLQRITVMPHDASWIQALENNGLDATHIYILHQDTGARQGTVIANTTRGRIDELASFDCEEVSCGVRYTMFGRDGYVEEDRIVFPNLLRRVNQIQIHTPIDDTHTNCYKLYFSREPIGRDGIRDEEPVDFYVQDAFELKEGRGVYPDVRYRMNQLGYQDIMAIETQGGIAPRDNWRLGTADRGIVLFEQMLLREIDRVRDGKDPVAVVRNPDDVIDTAYEFFRDRWHERLTQVVPAGVQVFAREQGSRTASAHEAIAARS